MEDESLYGSYTVREDTDFEDYVYWAGGTLDDKGEDRLNKNEPIQFDPRCLPIGSRIVIFVPVDDEGFADWPQFRQEAKPE